MDVRLSKGEKYHGRTRFHRSLSHFFKLLCCCIHVFTVRYLTFFKLLCCCTTRFAKIQRKVLQIDRRRAIIIDIFLSVTYNFAVFCQTVSVGGSERWIRSHNSLIINREMHLMKLNIRYSHKNSFADGKNLDESLCLGNNDGFRRCALHFRVRLKLLFVKTNVTQ